MKVLYISPYYTTFVHSQVAKLLKMEDISGRVEFVVRLYAWWRSSKYRRSFQPEKLRISVPGEVSNLLFYPNLPRDWMQNLDAGWIAKSLKKRYRKGDFDLIHAHTLVPAGVAAMRLAEDWGIPFVVTSHGADFYRTHPEQARIRDDRLFNKKTIRSVANVLRRADRVIAVSQGFADDILTHHPDAKMDVIPNGYDHETFFPGDRNESRQALSLPKDGIILLGVGNYVRTKGFEYMIAAMPGLVERFGDIRLYLIGSGVYEERYRAMIDELEMDRHIVLHPPVRHDLLATWFRAADLYVQPSLNETFGLALAEAQACGLPAVSTHTAGPSYILGISKGGLLVPPGNTSALMDAVCELLENSYKYKQMQRLAPENTRNGLPGPEERIHSLYLELISNRNRK